MRWTSSQLRYNEREPSLPAGLADGSRNVRRAAIAVRLSLRDEGPGGRGRLSG
jgi:hypothetical protein